MRILIAALAAIAVIAGALPVGAQDATTIAISGTAVDGSTVNVSGLLTLGADALEPMVVSEDPQGDARVPAGGFDIGNSTVSVDFSGTSPRLVVTQGIFGGMPDEDGNPPAMGFSWPIAVSGSGGDPLWLAAGSKGTNFTPSENWWTGLCTAGADGWICGTPTPGSVTEDAITWILPFSLLGAQSGRTVSASSAFGGSPRSFVWPSVLVTQSTAPVDTAPAPFDYLIPGLVEAGIAPAGTSAGLVDYSASTKFAHRTGDFALSLPAPTAAGSYEIFVRSCFGDGFDPTCVVSTAPLTL